MQYKSLLKPARLIRRYKRFLADIELPDGRRETIYCPNTGAMLSCAEPTSQIWYSTDNNPKRKYHKTWELTRTLSGHYICVNAALANSIVLEAFEHGNIDCGDKITAMHPEYKLPQGNSRLDFHIKLANQVTLFCEVKSVTYAQEHPTGMFPDAKTLRGQRHLQDLIKLATQGQRAMLIFCVMYEGITSVCAASHIDPDYAVLLRTAVAAGVEVRAYQTSISEQEIYLTDSITVTL